MTAPTKPGAIFPETSDEDIPSSSIHDITDGKPYRYQFDGGTLK